MQTARAEDGFRWCAENQTRSVKGGDGAGVQILDRYLWVVLSLTLKHCCFPATTGCPSYQETGGKSVQENRPGFCNRQFGFWQLGQAGEFPFSICFSVQNGRKSGPSIPLTLACALTQIPQIFHSRDNINNKIMFHFSVAKLLINIAPFQSDHRQTSTMLSTASCEVVARESIGPSPLPICLCLLLPCLDLDTLHISS